MDIYLFLYLVFVVAPVGTIVHECGHLLGAGTVQADKITLSIGRGKQMISFSLKRIRITVYAIFFLGGQARSKRKTSYKPMEIIWVTFCGLLSSSLFAVLFYFLYNAYSSPYIKLLFLFNGWLAIVNSIPFKINGMQSDGYTICKEIFHIAKK